PTSWMSASLNRLWPQAAVFATRASIAANEMTETHLHWNEHGNEPQPPVCRPWSMGNAPVAMTFIPVVRNAASSMHRWPPEQSTHIQTAAILLRNYYGWFEWAGKGGYALSPLGQDALHIWAAQTRQHAESHRHLQTDVSAKLLRCGDTSEHARWRL